MRSRASTHTQNARVVTRVLRMHVRRTCVYVRARVCSSARCVCVRASLIRMIEMREGHQAAGPGLAIPRSGAAAPLERAGMESAGDPGMASSGEANV